MKISEIVCTKQMENGSYRVANLYYRTLYTFTIHNFLYYVSDVAQTFTDLIL